MNKTDLIREHLPAAERLAQLAEEAAELAQAALKLRRTLSNVNPTPTSYDKALNNLTEEIGDVLLCLDVLGLPINSGNYWDAMKAKANRWATRLGMNVEG